MSNPIFDLEENPSQKAFVLGEESFSAYLGGVGAGKTFANILRNLMGLSQPRPPGVLEAPRGLLGAESYPVLDDIIMPQWEKIQNIILHKAPNSPWREVNYEKAKRRATLKNGARLDFRSLDKPNSLRGRELTTFGIDEGRNVPKLAWDRLFDRLRQPGYKLQGFVTSTPNGYDWMWEMFHEESPSRGYDPVTEEHFKWYNAPTTANAKYLPPGYIHRLRANIHGLMALQEIEGQFVGLTEGGVYPEWNPGLYLTDVRYDPQLPLYSFWDFGIGDLGVCIFAQIKNVPVRLDNGDTEFIPHLLVLDAIAEKDWTAKDWAEAWHDWLTVNVNGRRPNANYGDPAGKQRAQGSGTSVMDDLAASGVIVAPAPKKPADFSVRILRNMMSGGRVLANRESCTKLSHALSSHRWPLDKNGNRIGNSPVHDWTSHYSDALRYGAASLLSFFPARREAPKKEPPPPGSVGHVIEQLVGGARDDGYIGPKDQTSIWLPGQPLGA